MLWLVLNRVLRFPGADASSHSRSLHFRTHPPPLTVRSAVCCKAAGLDAPPPLRSAGSTAPGSAATAAAAAAALASASAASRPHATDDSAVGGGMDADMDGADDGSGEAGSDVEDDDDDAAAGVDAFLSATGISASTASTAGAGGSAAAAAADTGAEVESDSVRKLMERMRQTRDFVQSGGTVQATDRLMKEYRALMRRDTRKEGYTAQIIDDNLYEWQVRLFGFDKKEQLGRDLEEYHQRFGLDYIELHFKFPPEYPFKPPFVRVVRPAILGGYVLDGGALCMELLTPMGWSSAYAMDAIIPQLMATLVEGKARIVMQPQTNYDERVARSTFEYIVETHKRDGWFTPPKGKG